MADLAPKEEGRKRIHEHVLGHSLATSQRGSLEGYATLVPLVYPFGVYDMLGNVAELVLVNYDIEGYNRLP